MPEPRGPTEALPAEPSGPTEALPAEPLAQAEPSEQAEAPAAAQPLGAAPQQTDPQTATQTDPQTAAPPATPMARPLWRAPSFWLILTAAAAALVAALWLDVRARGLVATTWARLTARGGLTPGKVFFVGAVVAFVVASGLAVVDMILARRRRRPLAPALREH